jgi:hypothetical protein
MLATLCLCAACGRTRDIPPEETGTPNVMPREQILYREAQQTFQTWMKHFGQPSGAAPLYDLLTLHSRRKLAEQGAATRDAFATWFENQRGLARAPFFYTFTRIDILDIDVRDTAHALVTASVIVEAPSQKLESVGTFTLLREAGAWKIPFAESGDFERSWWQQDRKFSTLFRDEGLAHFTSRGLGVELLYPVTWDIDDNQRFRVPGESAVQTGVVLSYLNPATNEKEAFIRIWVGPALPQEDAVADSSAFIRVLRKEDAQLVETTRASGTLFVLTDQKNARQLRAWGAVTDAAGPFSRYAAIIARIIESISLPS